jgi:Protein of unknown function (DUF2889)
MPAWPDPPLDPIHTRQYVVNAYRKGVDEILIRGSVQDDKPGDTYVEGDPDPLTMHCMIVDLTVGFPSLQISGVEVVFETYPQAECPRITDHYRSLIGLSVVRGFTHNVRELFGGPRGCAHVTALLQAMAPVAVQCRLSMGGAETLDAPVAFRPTPPTVEDRRATIQAMVNTCHAWADGGSLVTIAERGEQPPLPLPIKARLLTLGLDPETWREEARARRRTP